MVLKKSGPFPSGQMLYVILKKSVKIWCKKVGTEKLTALLSVRDRQNAHKRYCNFFLLLGLNRKQQTVTKSINLMWAKINHPTAIKIPCRA